MSGITVEAACGTSKDCENRSEAENAIDTHAALCEECGESDIEMVMPNGDGAKVVKGTEPVDFDDNQELHSRGEDDYNLPSDGPSVDEDPLVWMPDEFTDTIDGTTAINRKGFEVLAHHYDISCRTEVCEALTNNERVVFKATAEDADGDTYTAFGSGGAERGDSQRPPVEMADTRAYKRAVSRATGVGMVAVSELQEGL